MKSIIFASKNRGKIKELNQLLHDFGLNVITMEDAGFTDDIEENGNTLEENALIKAKAIYQVTSKSVIADDSGLFVDALDGAPGIYSARYAGIQKSSADNNDLLLKNLLDITNRKAHFAAVLCLIEEDGGVHYFRGEVHGKIGHNPEGNAGFGYDPLFIPDGYEVSFGLLSDEIKNNISHRAEATKKLLSHLKGKNTT